MPHLTPTPEQLSIIDATQNQSTPLMISAYAGTAKTTTLQLAAPQITQPCLALAFNKKIAEELRPRLPYHFQVKTLNSLGHSAWAPLVPSRLTIDDRKLSKLVTQVAKDQKIHLTTSQWAEVRDLVSAAMLAGISLRNEGSPLTEDTLDNWRDLFDGSSSDFSLTYDLARETLHLSVQFAKSGTISFDDQIYMPTIFGGRFPKYPVVMIDEAQDLSPLNHRMLELVTGQRLIAVGDPKQAIYAFRGADSASMANLRKLFPTWLDRPLTTTFRCPRRIVERQQEHAPGFNAASSCIDGLVDFGFSRSSGHDFFETSYWGIDDLRTAAREAGTDQITILCRNNAPLLSFAFKLIRRGVGAFMLGRDIGRGLENLVKKLTPDESQKISHFLTRLESWHDREIHNAIASDQPAKAERIDDQYQCLLATVEGAQPSTVGDLLASLKNLFSRSDGKVLLSSIHRAKGLEWPLVVHLDPQRIPSKQALRDPVQMEQEKNLLYVAETRTKNTLLNLALEDFR